MCIRTLFRSVFNSWVYLISSQTTWEFRFSDSSSFWIESSFSCRRVAAKAKHQVYLQQPGREKITEVLQYQTKVRCWSGQFWFHRCFQNSPAVQTIKAPCSGETQQLKTRWGCWREARFNSKEYFYKLTAKVANVDVPAYFTCAHVQAEHWLSCVKCPEERTLDTLTGSTVVKRRGSSTHGNKSPSSLHVCCPKLRA